MSQPIRSHVLSKFREIFTNITLTSEDLERLKTQEARDPERVKRVLDPCWLDTLQESPEKIEKSIYNTTIKQARERAIERSWTNTEFKWLYKTNYTKVYSNLRLNKNADFVLGKIKYGLWEPEKIISMTSQELYPDIWEELILKNIKKMEQLSKQNNVQGTDMFRCGKCKKNNCTYYQMQTRSADEPMTTFITCLNCGKRWKC